MLLISSYYEDHNVINELPKNRTDANQNLVEIDISTLDSFFSLMWNSLKSVKYYLNFTLLNSIKYKDVHILYDKNGYVTEKLGKNLAHVLILPNTQVLALSSKYSNKKFENEEENVIRIEDLKLKSIKILVAV